MYKIIYVINVLIKSPLFRILPTLARECLIRETTVDSTLFVIVTLLLFS